VVSYRRAGSGPVLVLLHGIGSASASWLCQLQQLQATHCVLAWDAPGYGESSPLPMAQPAALDYGAQVWDWLDALGLDRGPLTLVGHSLGALMAAAAASLAPARVARLVLLSPAQGYGQASTELRESKLRDRLQALELLGPKGMAQQRGAAMLSPGADASLVTFVQANMALIHPGGYTQAAHMLAGADLARELQGLSCPVLIASGSADTITPAVGCEALAQRLGCDYRTLGPVGHACALEAADAVNKILINKETA
jgi:pimeloyl-ACP methyl ester carboxylesterase